MKMLVNSVVNSMMVVGLLASSNFALANEPAKAEAPVVKADRVEVKEAREQLKNDKREIRKDMKKLRASKQKLNTDIKQ